MSDQIKYSPPLKLWLISLSVFIFILCTVTGLYFVKLDWDKQPDQIIPSLHLNRLQEFSHNRTSGKFSVAVIGTSLTGDAFYFDREMNDFAADRRLTDLNFIRFFLEYKYQLKDYPMFLESLLDAEPHIIMLEVNHVFFDAYSNVLFTWHWDNMKRYIHGSVKRALDISSKPKNRNTEEFENFSKMNRLKEKVSDVENILRSYKIRRSYIFTRRIDEHQVIRDFFNKARKKGIKIIIYDLARTPVANKVYDDLFRDEYFELVQYYRSTYDIGFIRSPEFTDYELFRDISHYNQQGRERFCSWFVEFLRKERVRL